jgi:hypothetical protein
MKRHDTMRLAWLLAAGAVAAQAADQPAPLAWRGVHLMSSGASGVPLLKRLISEVLAPQGVNVVILEINYGFDYASHPELRTDNPVTKAQARELAALCREKGIRLIPQFQCLGHQSWAKSTFTLLTKYPQFDETPQIPRDNPGIYCRSWCPQHPEVNPIIFALMDELLDAFEADALHVGMDEVFLIASDQCPRCKGGDPAELFAKAVNDYHRHLVGERKVEMLMWGDRLLDAKATGYGEWEAAANGTHPAIDRIPKDIIQCDWHYGERASYPSVGIFLEKGFRVLPTGWRETKATLALLRDSLNHRDDPRMLGHLFSTWVGASELARVLLKTDDADRASAQAHQVAQAFTLGMKLARGETLDPAAVAAAALAEVVTPEVQAELSKPPAEGTPVAVVAPADLAATLRTAGGWVSGAWPADRPRALVLRYPRATPSPDGQACAVTARFTMPGAAKVAVQLYLTDDLRTDEWTGYRYAQLLHGERVLWEEDLAADRKGRGWTTVDISGVQREGEAVELVLRVVDKRGVHDYSTNVVVGLMRVVAD